MEEFETAKKETLRLWQLAPDRFDMLFAAANNNASLANGDIYKLFSGLPIIQLKLEQAFLMTYAMSCLFIKECPFSSFTVF